jgi:hypothetical protein
VKIRTKYQTNANGRGQILATSGGKQKTHNYDDAVSAERNHGRAAAALILAKFPETANGWLHGGTDESSEDGTVHVFTL